MAVLGYVPCCIVGWRLTLVTHRAVGLQALCRGLSGSAALYTSCCTLRSRPVELWSHLNINLSYFSILMLFLFLVLFCVILPKQVYVCLNHICLVFQTMGYNLRQQNASNCILAITNKCKLLL